MSPTGKLAQTFVGPSQPMSEYDKARQALAAMTMPNGFVLGDVIAEEILHSEWLALYVRRITGSM